MNTQEGIIESIVDLDLYKLTMQNAVIHKFPRYKVQFGFINRGKTPFPPGFAERLRKEIGWLSKLSLRKEEEEFLSDSCSYLYPTYIGFLRGYRYNPEEVGVIQKGDKLEIQIEGYWHSVILWETILMCLISELYFEMTGLKSDIISRSEREQRNIEKGKLFYENNMKVADFGTRRRFSLENHNEVITDLKKVFGDFFIGTSNVYMAMKHNLRPIGTHAHEWFMFHAAKYGYKMANTMALQHWVDVYKGDLGIALTDTYTTDAFFKSFDMQFGKLFDGVRHDSGDPFKFIDKVVEHYNSIEVDPTSKTIVFSDGLDPELGVNIHKACRGKIKDAYGIGTNLTNDVGVKPLNIVIKMTSANIEGEWIPTVKLSDNEGKHTGSPYQVDLAQRLLGIIKEETVEI